MPEQSKRQRGRRRTAAATLLLAYAALAMERADAALLPAVYREIGAALQASPTALGSIALSRSVVQAACYPLAAYLAARHDRLTVIALGAFLWAAATLLIGLSTTFAQMAVTAALNGVGLALQIPAIFAFVADSVDGTNRGMAFGWLMVASKAGTVGGTTLGLLMAPTSFFGVPGWRLAFLLLAAVGAAVGLSIRAFAAAGKPLVRPPKPVRQELQDFAREAKAVLRIPSFQVIVAQGLTGSFPWSALSFTAMWLELVGFSHGETAALMTLFKVATSLGGLFGGKMGDVLTRRLRNSGRIIVAQISAGSAIPLVGVLLLALPYEPATFAHHGAANLAAVRRQIGLQLEAAWILSMVNAGLHVSRTGRVANSLSASSGSRDCSCICLRHGQQFLLLRGAAPPACAPPGWLLLCSCMLVRCCFFHVLFAILLRGAAFD